VTIYYLLSYPYLLGNFHQFLVVIEDYADENRIYPHQADRAVTSRDIQPCNLEHIIKVLSFSVVEVLSVILPLDFLLSQS